MRGTFSDTAATADRPRGTAEQEPFTHPALFYRGEPEYLAGTVPFVTGALAAGEPVAVAVPRDNLELLRGALGSAAGDVVMVDMTEAGRNPGHIIPGVLRAFADRYPGRRVRIIGEPIWAGRSAREYPACAQHEALINHAFAGLPATILCPYDVGTLRPKVLTDALRTHPLIVDADGQRTSDRYAPDDVVADYNRPLPPLADATAVTVELTGLSALRHVAVGLAAEAGLGAERVQDVALALTELAGNSLEHGGGTAEVLMGTDEAYLVCQVRDSGRLADPLAGRRPAVPGQVRGRGLLLVHHVADLVRTHTGPAGTCVEARFLLGH
ncbi:anti-sigma factor RsbA family regulatory protein [Amycolatopsis sp. NPDC059021]|uniref:anti-sigma factor RsbA family regulatory protein n=1 Tax=Amycolatopsis sp. NPDC059021 TaxID=3346704 RepID=UPI00366BFED1